jgi:hypothetical protein
MRTGAMVILPQGDIVYRDSMGTANLFNFCIVQSGQVLTGEH